MAEDVKNRVASKTYCEAPNSITSDITFVQTRVRSSPIDAIGDG
jgi:hypothetical protein